MGKILDSAKKTADLLGGISESVSNNSSNIDSLENKCDSIESDLSSRCDELESAIQDTSDELTSRVESISENTVKVVSNYPQTEKGTHLVMDDDGLKAVTTWDEERGYRRLIYNRDPVVYVEFSLSNYNYYDIWINGEKIKLKEGSNWFEVEELSELTWFCDDMKVPLITAIIVRTKLSQSGGPFRLFSGVSKTKYIEVKIDKQTIPSINYLLYNCPKLMWTNCKEWDTSNVTTMSAMFYYCSSLTSLDLSNFDTSKVTNMGAMFGNCKKLTSLDLSNFDTSKVTNMMGMFSNCQQLTSLDLSNFDISKVTTSNSSLEMFENNSSLRSLIFPGMGNSPEISSIYLSDSPLDHDSLMSIFTYDRTENGLGTLTVKLSNTSKNILSEEEIASITSKGYTIA